MTAGRHGTARGSAGQCRGNISRNAEFSTTIKQRRFIKASMLKVNADLVGELQPRLKFRQNPFFA